MATPADVVNAVVNSILIIVVLLVIILQHVTACESAKISGATWRHMAPHFFLKGVRRPLLELLRLWHMCHLVQPASKNFSDKSSEPHANIWDFSSPSPPLGQFPQVATASRPHSITPVVYYPATYWNCAGSCVSIQVISAHTCTHISFKTGRFGMTGKPVCFSALTSSAASFFGISEVGLVRS